MEEIKILSVHSEEFCEFGRIITDIDTDEIVKVGEAVEKPESGSRYAASLPEFEALGTAKEITEKCFGELPAQIGYCWGYNSKMNALEWHTSSEINVAVTPLVLILARRQDIVNGKIDSSKAKAFKLEKGDCVEVYATSLHYCPCQLSKDGFGCVVALPKGTNTPLENNSDPLMTAKNKWLLAHVDNEALINRGFVPGVTGTNYEIKGE